MSKNYMAIDQHGTPYFDLGPHPRKVLAERFGGAAPERIYIDGANADEGKIFHIGYAVGDLWLTLFEVTPMRKEIKE